MPQMNIALGTLVGLTMMMLGGLDPSSSVHARESGIQGTPDEKRILVSKDVSASRYAIAQDRDEGSVTGNVFFTDDRSPAFLFCSPQGASDFSCSVADACASTGRESGIQRRPDGKGILVSKDVAGARYAITANLDDGSLTGNVFFTDGSPPVFLFCQSLGGTTYSCSAADRCRDTTCAPYSFLSNVTLPADFFSVPEGCQSFQTVGTVTLPADFFSVPSATLGPLAVGARQVVGNNPFGNITKLPNASASGRARAPSGAVQSASTFRDETRACIGGGALRLQCAVDTSNGSGTTFASTVLDQCTFPQNDGGVQIQDGVVFTTVPNFTDCDPLIFNTGREQLEEREPLVLEFLDEGGILLERQVDTTSKLVTYGAGCTNRAGTRLGNERVRDLTGSIDTVLFGGGELHVLALFSQVDQEISYLNEPECVPTSIRTAGSITSIDDRTGESYTTTYGVDGGLQYTLDDSELTINGGLTSQCTGTQSSFVFRTLETPLFDPAEPDGCPRDGRLEVSSNGTVIGQIVFMASGNVQLIEAGGRTTTYDDCNDTGLLLRCE